MKRLRKIISFALAAVMVLSMSIIASAAVTGAPPYVAFYKDGENAISMSQQTIVANSIQIDDVALTITVDTKTFTYLGATGTLLGVDIDFDNDGIYESEFEVVNGQLVIEVPDSDTLDDLLNGVRFDAKVDYTITFIGIPISHPYSDIDFGLQNTEPIY